MDNAKNIVRNLLLQTRSFSTMLDIGKLLTKEKIVTKLKEAYGLEDVLIIRRGIIFAVTKSGEHWIPIKDDGVPIENATFNDLLEKREDIATITPDATITAQDIIDVLAVIDAKRTCI